MGTVLVRWADLRARLAEAITGEDDEEEETAWDGDDEVAAGEAHLAPGEPPPVSDDEGTLVPEGVVNGSPPLVEAKPTGKKKSKGGYVPNKRALVDRQGQRSPVKAAKLAIDRLFTRAGKDKALAIAAFRLVLGALPPALRREALDDLDHVDSDSRDPTGVGFQDAWRITRSVLDYTENEGRRTAAHKRRENQKTAGGGSDEDSESDGRAGVAALVAAARKVVNTVDEVIGRLPDIKAQLNAVPGGEKPSAPLGRFAFPSQRAGSRGSTKKHLPPEPNTPLEDELYKAINLHFSDNEPMAAKPASALRSLLKRGMYSDVIKEPSTTNVYRGMSVPGSWLAAVLKVKNVKELPTRGKVAKGFRFVPRKGATTSWSIDKKVAQKFSAEATGSENQFALVLVASLEANPDRFLSGPGGTYKLSAVASFDHEKEATALGPIKVTHIEWIQTYDEELGGDMSTPKIWDAKQQKQKHDYLGIVKRFKAAYPDILPSYEYVVLVKSKKSRLEPKNGDGSQAAAEELYAALQSDPEAKKAWRFSVIKGHGDHWSVSFQRK